MKDFIILAVGTAFLTIGLAIAIVYGSAAMVRVYAPEPNHDAWRAEQYHKYLVRKGYINE